MTDRSKLETRVLGKTGLNVSLLGFGGLELDLVTADQADILINRVLDMGINVIDTAECYGNSETFIGQALGMRRQECYLFTKCGHASHLVGDDWQPSLLERSIERSLQRLQTDYLDLIFLHSCSYEHLLRGEVIEVLQQAKRAGKTRYIGYSGDRRAARYALECGAFDALQISINIADQEAIDTILPLAAHKGIGIVAKRPLANAVWKSDQQPSEDYLRLYWQRLKTLNYGFLKLPFSESAELALRFTASVPEVNVLIAGSTNVARIEQNVKSLAMGSLPCEQYNTIRRRWQSVTWWRRRLPGARYGWHGVV